MQTGDGGLDFTRVKTETEKEARAAAQRFVAEAAQNGHRHAWVWVERRKYFEPINPHDFHANPRLEVERLAAWEKNALGQVLEVQP